MSSVLYLCPTRDKSGSWGDPTNCKARLYDEDTHNGKPGTTIRCPAHGEVFEVAPESIERVPILDPDATQPPKSGPNAPKPEMVEVEYDMDRLRAEYYNFTGVEADKRWGGPRLKAQRDLAEEQAQEQQNNPRSGVQDLDVGDEGSGEEESEGEGEVVPPEPEPTPDPEPEPDDE